MRDVVDALVDLRSMVDWPDESVDLTARAVAQLQSRRPQRARRPRWPLVALGAVVAVGAGVPAAAHFLSIGGVGIELTGEGVDDDIATELDVGSRVALREDEARPPSLGDPSAAFAGRPPGAYTEVWDERGGGYVLITRFPGHVDDELIHKRVYEGGTVEVTTVDGEVAYWISGQHGFLYLDADGRPVEDTLRLSGRALVWTRDRVTYRLESTARSLDESVALADAMS